MAFLYKVINRGQVDVGKYGNIIMSGWGIAPPQETVERIAKRLVTKYLKTTPVSVKVQIIPGVSDGQLSYEIAMLLLTKRGFICCALFLCRFDPTIVKPDLQPDLTPFHYAIIRQNDELALKMLDYGANPNLKDR